jgi:thiol:disulfide interchange protein
MDIKKVLIVVIPFIAMIVIYYLKFNQNEIKNEIKEEPKNEIVEKPNFENLIPPLVPVPDQENQSPKENKPEKLSFFNNYQEALSASKKHNRPIFLYFETEWCKWCKKMKSETLFDVDVENKLTTEYITCIVEDRTLLKKYKVSGVPSYLILDSSENVVMRDSGFKNKEEMMNWLKPKNVSSIDEN